MPPVICGLGDGDTHTHMHILLRHESDFKKPGACQPVAVTHLHMFGYLNNSLIRQISSHPVRDDT